MKKSFNKLSTLYLKNNFLGLNKLKNITLPISRKYFQQTNDLQSMHYTAEAEIERRTSKFVEYTDKVYKPSKTIQFDRNGELLLFYCDNIKNSTIYFKYPYILIDLLAPLAMYNFFIDPCK